MNIKDIDPKDIILKTQPEPIDNISTVINQTFFERHDKLREWLYHICIAAPIISISITVLVGILVK